jgi:hypothetical protein
MRERSAATYQLKIRDFKVTELVLDITLSFAYDTRAVALAGRQVKSE